jgi:hypothetical protein
MVSGAYRGQHWNGKQILGLHETWLFITDALICYTEAVFLVVRDPSMNELWAT